ncbi:STIP1 [Mytilus edulis]|uniref:STIP1 n=1 Tax=Mytilus edulis TaxID=6550 RepID=A0A8S3TLK8_MYTED|nr:STIP1 [Mytilus edulis]
MPIEIFNSGEPTICDEEAGEILKEQFAIRQVLEILTRFSLFQRYRSESLSVHRLVQEVIRSQLQEDEKYGVLQCATRMINKALISTTAPHTVIESESLACRGLLNVWNKLAANANTLKIHLNVSKENKENKDIYVSLEYVRIMQASAIYNSLFQRQDEALRDQQLMLNIIASLDLDKDTCRELTNIKVPLLGRDRIRIQNSIATVLQIDDNENQIESAANIPLSTESLRVFGNQAFKEERYEDALQYYTEALRSCSKNTYDQRILSNRSLVYLKLHRYTYALNDANACIEIDPSCWKAHVWKSYAIAELIGTDKLLPEMEGSGRSSACIASFLKKECLLEYKMKVNYPILLYKIIDGENLYNNLRDRIMSLVESPFTTYMLKKGRYTFTQLLKTLKSCQVIGVEPGVEIDIELGFIFPDL